MIFHPRRRLIAVALFLLPIIACTESFQPPAETETTPTAASLSTNEAQVVGEFIGHYDDVTGELTFEEVAIEDWASIDTSDPDVLRRVTQSLYCEQRVTEGVPGTVSLLTTIAVQTGSTTCGVAGDGYDFVYDALGVLCATVEVTNHGTGTLFDVTSKIVLVSPPENAGYEFPMGTGHDPAALPAGLHAPTDAGGGLFYYGDIGAAAAGSQQWTFRNPGGAFTFRGEIMARSVETGNGADDNCDGWVDDRLSTFADDALCRFDEDCISGLCHDIDSGVTPEPVGDCATTCAEGRWGDPCADCPGGAGAAQCNAHGTCDDGAAGTGVCTCSGNYAGTACD